MGAVEMETWDVCSARLSCAVVALARRSDALLGKAVEEAEGSAPA